MTNDYRPRISITLPEELKRRLTEAIPWGMQNRVFCVIVEDLVSLIEKYGINLVVYAFSERELTLNKMCKLNIKEENKNED